MEQEGNKKELKGTQRTQKDSVKKFYQNSFVNFALW